VVKRQKSYCLDSYLTYGKELFCEYKKGVKIDLVNC